MLSVLALIPAADACSCVQFAPERAVVVSDDFPVGGAIRVFLRGDWPIVLRHIEADTYRLREPSGRLVPLDRRVEGAVVVLQPARLLERDTTYTLERAGLYRGDRPLTDAQAIAMFEDAPLERRWSERWTLHTEAASPDRTPVTISVGEATFHERSGGGDCGPGESIRASWEVSGTPRDTDVFSIEVRGQGTRWRGQPDQRAALFSDLFCMPMKVHTDVSDPPQIRVALTDSYGVQRATSGWVTASLGGERRPAPPDHPQRLIDEEAREHARLAPLGAVPISDAPAYEGPPGCPEGLSVATDTPIGELVWSGLLPSVSAMVTEEAERTLQLRDLHGVPLPVPVFSDRARVVSGDGVVVVLEGLQAAAWTPEGVALWSRAVSTLGAERSHRFAAIGGDRLLVGWTWWGLGSSDDRWALLDIWTGETIAEGSLRHLAPEGRDVREAVWDGERFVLRWHWSAPMISRELGAQPAVSVSQGFYLSFLSGDGLWGATVPAPEALGNVQHMVPGPDGLYLVGVKRPDLLLGVLGGDAEPVLLNPGAPIGGGVSMAAWEGGLAVAWEAGGVWVTTISEGRAAPPVQVPGRHPDLLVTEDGLTMFYGSPRGGAWRAQQLLLFCKER